MQRVWSSKCREGVGTKGDRDATELCVMSGPHVTDRLATNNRQPTWQLRASNSLARSENAMISVGHTNCRHEWTWVIVRSGMRTMLGLGPHNHGDSGSRHLLLSHLSSVILICPPLHLLHLPDGLNPHSPPINSPSPHPIYYASVLPDTAHPVCLL